VSDGITINEAAKLLGMSAHTLRYYEKEGLLDVISRTEGGIRRYQPENLDFLRFLHRLRKTGMSIRQTREYAILVRQGRETSSERAKMMQEHKQKVLDEIAIQQSYLKVIDLKLELYAKGWVHGDSPCVESESLTKQLNEIT
jgi:DNA-binding transcriptional MerR regulator